MTQNATFHVTEVIKKSCVNEFWKMEVMKRWLKLVADLLLPRVCAVCGRKLNAEERNLCLYCLAELPQTFFWERRHNQMADKFNSLIERGLDGDLTGCVNSVASGVVSSGVAGGLKGGRLERYAYAVALFFYDGKGQYRKITQQLKYHANLSLGRDFGRMLAYKIGEARHFEDVDVIVPVPLHWTRRWTRGYNQAEVIARGIAEVLGVDVRTDILRRSRRTRTQTKIDPAKKAENVRGAFAVNCAALKGYEYYHIVLVDDVFTSGSTLHNCFLALRAELPVSVRISVATLAYVGSA